MNRTSINQFSPDYAIHPGEVLREVLESRDMNHAEFARRCGISTKTISQILNAKEPVSPDSAIKFERVLGISAVVWNNLESQYRLFGAQQEARQRLEQNLQWTKRFPVRELVQRGFMEKPDSQLDAFEKLLGFFGIGSIEALERKFDDLSTAYRCSPSFAKAPESVAAWLRMGELIARENKIKPFQKSEFRTKLNGIRGISTKPPATMAKETGRMCAEAGVYLVILAELPKTRISGATRWLGNNPLIMLSLRHKTDDHFWFTFFHEAAHILYHGKKRTFVDDEGGQEWADKDRQAEEDFANDFAAKVLIPDQEFSRFVARESISKNRIRAFAKALNIAPGIVVGRLQHDGYIKHSWCNDLKRRLDPKDIESL